MSIFSEIDTWIFKRDPKYYLIINLIQRVILYQSDSIKADIDMSIWIIYRYICTVPISQLKMYSLIIIFSFFLSSLRKRENCFILFFFF